jgi:nicotinic acid phosphoribosyltransferase
LQWIHKARIFAGFHRIFSQAATNGTELNAFSDRSAVSSWAVSGMAEAIKEGIVSGMATDRLATNDNATRAEAAAMIYKLLTVLGK